MKKGIKSKKKGERWFLQFQLQDLWSLGDCTWNAFVSYGVRRPTGKGQSLPNRGSRNRQTPIGIHAGTRLHSYELERAAHQSFGLSLVSGAYGNPAMISRIRPHHLS